MIKPKPPTDAEKSSYLETKRRIIYPAGFISYLILITGMWLFTTASPLFAWFGLFSGLVTFYLGISYLLGFLSKDFNHKQHLQIISNHNVCPTVDIYLPCCGEPLQIIENTYEHVLKLSETNPNITVYVLDDKGSQEVAKLAEKFKFNYIARPDKGVLKKAGNLRHAFARTFGEFIVIFDADFCPRTDFLDNTLPYFYDDEKIAIVQTPQFFSIHPDQTWIEKGAGYVQELFYRLIQTNRDNWGAAICVGTCAVYRRKSLEPFGGTAAIGYSEDVHTGFNVVNDGWKLKYIPIPLSKGICPDTVPSYFIQQYRWAMGSISLFLNKDFWKSNLSIMQKVCFLSGMLYYITTAIGVFAQGLPGLIMILIYPEHVFWFNMIFSLPSIIYGIGTMAIWNHQPFGMYAQKTRTIAYYSHWFALVDKIKDSAVAWIPSGVATKTSRFITFRTTLFYWTSFQTITVLCCAVYRSHYYPAYHFIPIILLSLYNYVISMSILRDQE